MSGSSLFAASILFATSLVPPPPPTIYEIWTPSDREHSVSSTCGTGSASFAWSFQSGEIEIEAFSFNRAPVSRNVVAEIDAIVEHFEGDMHVKLDCNPSIVRVLMIQSVSPNRTPRKSGHVITNGTEVLEVKRSGME